MKFYDVSKPLYPRTDASGISLRVGLFTGKGWYVLWVRQGSSQYSIVPYCIHSQKPIQHGVAV